MQIKSFTLVLVAFSAMVVFSMTGCENPDSAKSGDSSSSKVDDGEGEKHVAPHAPHGPFHGHIIDIDSLKYQAEWVTSQENNIIRIYVLDGEAKDGVAVKADRILVIPMTGNDEDLNFELVAENPNAEGESAVYMLDDFDLRVAMAMGVKIEFTIGDDTFHGEIEAHEPRDH